MSHQSVPPVRGFPHSLSCSVCVLFLTLPCLFAADARPGKFQVERPSDPVTLITLRLDRGLVLKHPRSSGPRDDETAPVILHLFRRGKTITSGWAMAEALNGRGKSQKGNNDILSVPLSLDTQGLNCEGNSISGTVIRMHIKNARAWEAEKWTITATVSNSEITGNFTCHHPEDYNRQTGIVSFDGSLTGRVLSSKEWQARSEANALKAGADWPCWLGPNSNGQAIPYDGDLVERWEDARLAWRAEVDLVPGSPGQGHPAGGTRHDYNGPVVADGKVYLFIMEPDVDGPMYNGLGKPDFRSDIEKQNRGKQQARWIMASLVHDVGYCFDASTGALLWRTVFPRRGASGNFVGKGKGGHWSTPVIKDGRVYWCGSNSRVYCLDANTGEALWEQILVPGIAKSFEASVKRYIGEKRDQGLPYHGKLCNHLQASPCLAGGVLICPAKDQLGDKKSSGSGLYGLDPATGAVLWGPIPPLKPYASVFRWHYKGQDYALTPEVRCIDPKTGKELWNWQAPGMRGGGFCGAVNGDLYMPRRNGKKSEGRNVVPETAAPILQLTPTGATLKGAIPVAMSGNNTSSGVGVTCDNNGHFFYCLGPGGENNPELSKPAGIYVCDSKGALVAKCIGMGRHFMGYGTLIFSNNRVFVPGNSKGMSMVNWDSDSKTLSRAGHLGLNYYWCSCPAMADGRLFIRTNEGLVCYDLRTQE